MQSVQAILYLERQQQIFLDVNQFDYNSNRIGNGDFSVPLRLKSDQKKQEPDKAGKWEETNGEERDCR